MAHKGPAYGFSRECLLKSQAKFDTARAANALKWIQQVLGLELCQTDQCDDETFAGALKDGIFLCQLLNALESGTVPKINTIAAPFKQRENLEFFLNGCTRYGLKVQDTFQVNDLYESKNLYMVVDCIYALGGLAQRKSFDGPLLGVRMAKENRRNFSAEVMNAGHTVIGLQSGSNTGASQKGMGGYGVTRQIIPNGK